MNTITGLTILIIISLILASPIILIIRKIKNKNTTTITIKTENKIELIKRAEALQMSLNDYINYVLDKESHLQ